MTEISYIEGVAYAALGFGVLITIAVYVLRRYFFDS